MNFKRIGHIQDKIKLISGDLLDHDSLTNPIKKADPDEAYKCSKDTGGDQVGEPKY